MTVEHCIFTGGRFRQCCLAIALFMTRCRWRSRPRAIVTPAARPVALHRTLRLLSWPRRAAVKAPDLTTSALVAKDVGGDTLIPVIPTGASTKACRRRARRKAILPRL